MNKCEYCDYFVNGKCNYDNHKKFMDKMNSKYGNIVSNNLRDNNNPCGKAIDTYERYSKYNKENLTKCDFCRYFQNGKCTHGDELVSSACCQAYGPFLRYLMDKSDEDYRRKDMARREKEYEKALQRNDDFFAKILNNRYQDDDEYSDDDDYSDDADYSDDDEY